MFDQMTLACENANTPSFPPVNVVSHTHPLSMICVDPAKNFNLYENNVIWTPHIEPLNVPHTAIISTIF